KPRASSRGRSATRASASCPRSATSRSAGPEGPRLRSRATARRVAPHDAGRAPGRAGRLRDRPDRAGRARARDPRARRSRATGEPPRARDRRDAGDHARALRRRRVPAGAGRRARRDDRDRRGRGAPRSRRARARERAGRARARRRARGGDGGLQAAARSHLRALRAGPLRRARDGGDIWAPRLPPSRRPRRDRAPPRVARGVPRARAARRRLRAREVPARDRAPPGGRIRAADLPARRAGRPVRPLPRARGGARRAPARDRRRALGARGRDRARAAGRARRPLDAAAPRSGRRARVGLDADPAARAPARRRAAARDLRPRRLGRAERDDRRLRRGRDLGDARTRGGAGPPGERARARGARARLDGLRGGGLVKRFAALLDGLLLTPSRNGKLRLLREYFAATPDPDRGWALAALTAELSLPEVKPSRIRDLAVERVDPVLLRWSWDFVGDLAETVALLWPVAPGRATDGDAPSPDGGPSPRLVVVVERLRSATRAEAPALLAELLDALDSSGRYALLKLVTGELRVGVSARLAKIALAELAAPHGIALDEVEEVWHGLAPPYGGLFEWIEGRAPRPAVAERARFRPLMLAQPIEEDELVSLDPAAYRAEWKWDGIRVQLVAGEGVAHVYSRS